MGLDFILGVVRGCTSDRDYFAREVPQSSALLFNSAPGVAVLVGLRRPLMAPAADRRVDLRALARREALSAERVPQNFARGHANRWNEMVFERGLFARRETRDVRSGVPAVLLARPGIHCGVAEPAVVVASDHSGSSSGHPGRSVLEFCELHDRRDFWRRGFGVGRAGTRAGANRALANSHHRGYG